MKLVIMLGSELGTHLGLYILRACICIYAFAKVLKKMAIFVRYCRKITLVYGVFQLYEGPLQASKFG
jgi:hypothetical protein